MPRWLVRRVHKALLECLRIVKRSAGQRLPQIAGQHAVARTQLSRRMAPLVRCLADIRRAQRVHVEAAWPATWSGVKG